MNGRTLRFPFAVAAFAALTLAAGQPVLADTPLGHTGTVGAHSLTDTHSTPGAKCHYEGGGVGVGFIDSIKVRPPNMSPVRTKQIAGWQFTVERRFVGSSTGPWKQVYHSVIQTTSIGGGDSGGFTSMTAPISVPSNEGTTGEHFFRVIVKMFWYHADSSVMGTARNRVDFYREIKGNLAATFDGSCGGLSFS